ncbi:hypothetical protein AB2N08_12645 [Massilia aurea]|uniref:hypothetical protein n=1 Tax=Massilia aurea TaxID=373040 RepID=UPI003462B51F
MAMRNNTISSPALAAVANGSEFILTAGLGKLMQRAQQTIRKAYCQTGHFFGIVPVKFGNRLHWRVSDVDALLAGAGK